LVSTISSQLALHNFHRAIFNSGSLVTPNLQERAKKQEIREIVKKIYFLESTNGKYDSCLAKGLKNGYGFRYNSHEQKCFKDHKEVRTLVERWIEDKQNRDWTIQELTCYYNTGLRINNCPYYENFKKLAR